MADINERKKKQSLLIDLEKTTLTEEEYVKKNPGIQVNRRIKFWVLISMNNNVQRVLITLAQKK
jgi:hypothetical protein